MNLRAPVVIACAAPYGAGGMGRHLQELDDYCRARNLETRVFSAADAPRWTRFLNRFTPLRFSPSWQGYLESVVFDRQIAKLLPEAKTFIGFNGQALHSMRRARSLGYDRILHVAATPHINLTVAQLHRAFAYAPVEPLGYVRAHHQRYLAEYLLPDEILYASEYVRESFVRENFQPQKLTRFDLTPHPKYKPPGQPKASKSFRVVYIGSLNMIKGIPTLLDAFAKFDRPDAELILVGGSGTSQMRRYLESRCAGDRRIRIAPGDPLPALQAAHVCVHPAFQDGFAYAPAEALACGVPAIVTDHTGMKEKIREGENGFIVPAGDPAAIVTALRNISP